MTIHKIDTHPFFLRVLECGRKSDRLPDSFFDTLEEEGARIAVAIAKHYYNVTREADVIHATNIMLGVFSLALRELSGGDTCTARRVCEEQTLSSLFRTGWGLLSTLAKGEVELEITTRSEHVDTKHAIDLLRKKRERDLLEVMAVTNGSLVWDGYRQYQRRQRELQEGQRMATFHLWIERNYYNTRDEAELAPRPATLCASLAVSRRPHAPLNRRQLLSFFKLLTSDPKGCEHTIRERLASVRAEVPKEWRSEWSMIERAFFRKVFPVLCENLRKGMLDEAFEFALQYALAVENTVEH
ncbi:MAG: hypothetical protein KBD21_02960 [Candidatus Pacebacteria bacterium]|nr:hypothetical protein [Candidatus Paceibacterota bacterium]